VAVHLAGKHAPELELADLLLDRSELGNDIRNCVVVLFFARERIELARIRQLTLELIERRDDAL
jgi:hypothetical protein